MHIPIDKLIRSKRRTISLIIERDGALLVRAPLGASSRVIETFVREKTDWILRARERLLTARVKPVRRYGDGETFPFLGSWYALKLVETQRPALKFENGFTLSQAARPNGERFFVRWYREQALRIISERVRGYARRYNYSPARVRISSARTRWGSCSPDGTLNFTWRLIMAPLEVVDYVVLHELVHLRVKNHSGKFWAGVEEMDPLYRDKRKWLRENGGTLDL